MVLVFLLFHEVSEKLDEVLEVWLLLLQSLKNSRRPADSIQVVVDFLQVRLEKFVFSAGLFQLLRAVLAVLNLKDLHLVGE